LAKGAVIYPSFGLTINTIAEDDLGRAAARAYNRMTADMFAPFAARFAPVAVIPARTPDAAIEELEYAVGKLGFKAIMLRGNQERPIPSAAEGIDPRKAAWYCDSIALDPEAFEMVEKGFVTEQDFREFTFTNAARLHTGNNPAFFKGTVVEQAVADELGLKTPSRLAKA